MLLLDTTGARIFWSVLCQYNREELLRKIKDDDGGNFRPFVVGSICKPSVLTLAEGSQSPATRVGLFTRNLQFASLK